MELQHIGYLVKNIDKSVKAFKALGYEEISYTGEFITDDTLRGCLICFLQNGSSVVELVSPKDETSPIYGLLSKYKNMSYHLCFESANIKEDMENLKKQGFMIFIDLQPAPAFEGRNVVFMLNNSVGIIEIVEKN